MPETLMLVEKKTILNFFKFPAKSHFFSSKTSFKAEKSQKPICINVCTLNLKNFSRLDTMKMPKLYCFKMLYKKKIPILVGPMLFTTADLCLFISDIKIKHT